MQARLIYNAAAGTSGQCTAEQLMDALRNVGFEPLYTPTEQEEELTRLLAEESDIFVVAGGDGTVRATATRLVGRNASLAILPMGTANNIAMALNIAGEPPELIAGLANVERRPFDLGVVRGPWGQDYFLEGAGFGFFADLLATYDPEKGKSPVRSIQAMVETVLKSKAYPCRLNLGGEEVAGQYLLVEALNVTAVGPQLKFAPEADPSDGLLDVVRIHQNDREGLAQYLTRLMAGELNELQSVQVSRVPWLEMTWTGFTMHADAEVRPRSHTDEATRARAAQEMQHIPPERFATGDEDVMVRIEVLPGALELWIPQQKE